MYQVATTELPLDVEIDVDGSTAEFEPVDDLGLSEGSYRPALVKLVKDIQESEQALLRGFDSRRAVLLWTQQLAVRTLGEMPQDWFHQMARQFRGVPSSAYERTLVSALRRPIGYISFCTLTVSFGSPSCGPLLTAQPGTRECQRPIVTDS